MRIKKKFVSILLTLTFVLSCLTGCSYNFKAKVAKSGDAVVSVSIVVTEDEMLRENKDMDKESLEQNMEFSGFTKRVNGDTVEYVLSEKEKYTASELEKDTTFKRLHPTYCIIKPIDIIDDSGIMETDYYVGPETPDRTSDPTKTLTMKFSVTFPYEVAKTNGKLSKDKKTVTWDILKMNAKGANLKAYTVKYAK